VDVGCGSGRGRGGTGLAIYHLTAKVISRARGQSAVAAAAYRSASLLHDERYGITHNYTRRHTTLYSEILAPSGAPAWAQHREMLWNRVEAGERRKDSQLARLVEISLPSELSLDESVALLRDFVVQEFVAAGMIADLCIRQSESGPYAHIMLTLREAAASGFGPKMRQWNRKSNLLEWRTAWAERANLHLARAGHAVRIDHRSLEAQQSELIPGRNVGVGRSRQDAPSLPEHLHDRIAERQQIATENGRVILEDPSAALRALCRQRPSFTHQDLVDFLRPRTADPAQLAAAIAAISASGELVALAPQDGKAPRFTSQDMLEAERSLMKRATAMASRRGHAVAPPPSVERPPIRNELEAALEYTLAEGDCKAFAASPDGGTGEVLTIARQAWESHGLSVLGAAPSRTAANALQAASGIASQTLELREQDWKAGSNPVTSHHVVVIDGAEMIGLKQLERILAVVDKARGKIVLVGDGPQLNAMGTLSPLWDILEKVGANPRAADHRP
jgi:Ti-type conjugative transfer relaxase TraA